MIPAASALLAAVAAMPSDAPLSATVADEPAAFKLSLSLEAWFPRLEGNFTDGPADVDVRTPDLHDSEPSFAGALTFSRDRLSVALRGFSFSTSGGGAASDAFTLGGLSVGAGDAIDTSFSWWSVGAQANYDFYRPLAAQTTPWADPRADWTAPANNTDLSIFALVSADVQGMQRSIADRTSGLSTDANETFAVVDAGLGFRLAFDTKESFPIVRRVELGASFAAGAVLPMAGGNLGFGPRIEADITFWFCQEGAAYFGYRYVGGSYEGDEMALGGSLQGIRGGVRFAF